MQKTNSLVIPGWYMHFFSPAQVLKILMAVAKMVPRFWQTSLSFTGILLSRRQEEIKENKGVGDNPN